MPTFILRFFVVFALCLGSFAVTGQVAGFTTDDTAGCAPLIVHFTNTSTGATNYTWNLGDGSGLLTFTDASTSYTSVGTYTVTLTAYNGAASSTYSTVIRVYANPTVSFTVTDTSICPGTPVTFTSTSTPGAWGGLTYTWNFGDGGASSSASQVYSYAFPGFYNVTLYATNVKGCVGSHEQFAYMDVFTPASVNFNVSSAILCKAPDAVTFINTTTGTGPFTYTWRFGDGATSPATAPAHTYTAPGSYTVTLRVTDHNGCIDSLVQPAYISVGNLAASFTPVSTACPNASVIFTNTSTAHISSQWSFGDGGTSTSETPVYSYSVAGTYNVRLIVYNGGTCYDTVTHPITIVAGPTGSFAVTPTSPCPPPTALTFTGTVSPGSTVSWIFSDTTTGTGVTTPHTYHYSKIYTTDMIISNSTGCKDTVVKKDTLYNLNVSLSASGPISGCAPLAVNFSAYDYSSVFDPSVPDTLYLSYPYAITGYTWNFGDGSATSASTAPIHTYTAAGLYTATCTITTSNGCTATTATLIKVGVPPIASFTAIPRHVCADRTTTFTSTSTGIIDYYSWSFGDGGVVSPGGSTEVHLDSVPGIHTVSLIAFYNSCPSLPYTLTDSVDSPRALIHFTYACIPNNGVNFTDASLGDNTHLWMFGDATTSTALNPVHDYPALATYTVKLATYNIASGCRDTTTSPIVLSPPVINFFIFDSIRICRDRTDTIYSTVSGSTPVINYKWYDNGTLVDSTDATLMRDFHVRGEHTISLIIKDSRTCLDTFTAPNFILVAKPIDSFSFTPIAGCAPATINFTDLSTDVTGATINHYFWSFGDGDTTSTGSPAITHSYTANGTYHIEEIVRDNIDLGCMDTMNVSTITINKPTAGFSVSGTSVCTNTNVHFTNTSTGYTGSEWYFGDGAVSTVTSPTHVYTVSGVYTVKLVVLSGLGCTDTMTLSSHITVNPAPTASFYMNDSFAICPPLNVSFINTSSGAASYYWLLGDGSHSFATSPGDIYTVPGIYTIKLAAISSNGCTDTAVGHATIFGYSGAFSYTPLSGCSPLAVHFSAVLTSATSIVWDFNDGTTSVSSLSDTISHTYHAAGAYLPKLILTDSSGCLSFSLGADTIKVDTVIPNFVTVPTPGCQNSSIAFINTSESFYSTIASNVWTFVPGITSGAALPSYTYSVSGVYPVTLSETDGDGCTGTITKNVTVNPTPAAITGIFSLCAGSTTTLTDPAGSGTWSISGTAGIATVGSASGTVTGVLPGTTNIVYISSITGCSISAAVTVHPSAGPITGASTLCTGTIIALTDTTAGGSWSSSNTAMATVGSATGTVTGVGSGVVTITYSFTGSCFVTKTITVNTMPVAISGPSVVCIGYSATLTDGVPGGSWSSSNLAAATVGSATGIVWGAGLGNTVITYSTGGSCSVTKAITVNASPAPISGVLSVCSGSTTTLSDPSAGGVWSSAELPTATVTSGGVVTGLLADTVTIFYTVAGTTGCAAKAIVTVNPNPAAISGPFTVCAGLTITLIDGVSGGVWSSSNTLIATAGSGGVVAGVSSGIVSITYSTGAGCQQTRPITVNPLGPITGTTAICAGHTTTLADTAAGGTWSSSNSAVATIVTGTGFMGAVAPGTTAITYLLPTGCSATVIVTVNLTPPSITGATHVCLGSTAVLLDGGGGIWSSGSTAIATVGSMSGVIGGVALGPVVITYSVGSGCTASATITVDPLPSAISIPATICPGTSTTLSDPSAGGAWSVADTMIASAGSATGSITGILTGSDTVIYTLATGCRAITVVTVNPLPSAITGASTICLGLSTPFTDIPGGGTWSSSNSGIASVVALGTVTGVSIGPATITYKLPTGCYATKVISVNLSPSSTTGVDHVCIGSTTTLSDPASGGVWSSSATSIATVIPAGAGAGVVTGIAPGVTTVTYSLGAGCTTTAIVTVNPLPGPLNGPTEVCAGYGITLSDSVSGGAWSSGSTGIATVLPDTGIVTGASAGIAIISYSLGSGCTATIQVTVDLSPPAITGAHEVCIGQTAALGDPAIGGTWSSSNDTIAPVSTSGVVSGSLTGTVTINYTQGGCPSSVLFTVNPLPGPITGATFLCLELPYTLLDATLGGAWSSPTGAGVVSIGATVPVITGVGLGTAIVTYTLPTGCSTTTMVTVNPVPPPVTGATIMCAGQSVVLGDPMAGGFWTSGNSAIAVVTPTVGGAELVTGISGGTVPISYTAGGCPAIAEVMVNPLPAPITGARNLCPYGDTVTVNDATAGGIWSSTLATVSDSGYVISYGSGVAILTYTMVTGCRVTDTFTVYPGPSPIAGDNHLCVGYTTTLSDTSTTGAWSSGNTGVAVISTGGVVTGHSAGIAVISYTLPVTGCKETDSVFVSPLPSPVIGPSNVCAGFAITLSDTVSGGVWISSSAAIATTGTTVGLITGASAGVATITYNLGSGCRVLQPVTVNPLPLVYAMTGGGNYCSGTPGIHIGLIGSDAGITYKLYNGSTLEGTVTGTTGATADFGLETLTGTYKVVATNSSTTCAKNMPDSVTVTIIPSVVPSVSITVSTGDTICAGTPVTYTAIPVNGGPLPLYQWVVNTGITGASSAIYSYTPLNNDVVSAMLISSAVCAIPDSVNSPSVTMTVDSPVILSVTITANPGINIQPGQSDTLTAVVTGGGAALSYQWEINGSPVTGANTATFINTYNTSDSVTCVVTAGDICNSSAQGQVAIFAGDNGVKAPPGLPQQGEVTVLPNPNKGEFTIKGSLGAGNEEVSLEITDVLGQVVYKDKVTAKNGKLNERIQLSNTIANGVYMLNLRTTEGNRVFHVVVGR